MRIVKIFKNKLFLNTVTSVAMQITAIVCGFIVPRFILQFYGSSTNGLVNSITQFVQVISFFELGVGAVVQSALYAPLVQKDDKAISRIIVSAQKYFRMVALFLGAYIVFLLFVYPLMDKNQFGVIYIDTLIVVISLSFFAQYLWGMPDMLLLRADQRGYIVNGIQIVTITLNTITCLIMMVYGMSIQAVKLATSLIYLLRPILMRIYITRKYRIDRHIKYSVEPIIQKWNGIAQHIAAFVLDGTDSIVLTLFTTFSDVSVYGVYNLVLYGMKQLILTASSGIKSYIGNLWARKEKQELIKSFEMMEWGIHNIVTFLFVCTGVLIIPFVTVYTKGITDKNYILPLFALLITFANAIHCMRLPYNILILAAGHYKQTQRCYIIAAIVNVVLSLVFVQLYGLIGVAIGTLIAVAYQTVWMIVYDSRKLIKMSVISTVKLFFTDALVVVGGLLVSRVFSLSEESYYSWFVLAIQVAASVAVCMIITNVLFHRDRLQIVWNVFANRR
jgi:O-antigen/teichoic acid export membrane protein